MKKDISKSSSNEIDLEQLFENIPLPIVVLRADKDLTIVAQNNAHAALTLKRPGEVIGLPMLSAFPDTSQKYQDTGVSDLAESFRRVITSGKPDIMPAFQYDIPSGDGSFVEKWWVPEQYPIFASDGSVSHIYQKTSDITEQMVSKREVQHNEQTLQAMLGLGLVSLWSWDMKNDVVTGDKNLADRFGVSYSKVVSGLPLQVFLDSIHAEDRERVSKSILKTVQQDIPFQEEYRTLGARKQVNWVIARGSLQNDDDGNPEYFSGVLFDITDRKLAEIKLRDAQLRYDAIFSSSVMAIAVADTRGKILDANKTFLRLFGYTKKELADGLSSADVSADAKDQATQKIYSSLAQHGETEAVRKEYVRKNGSQFTGLVTSTMLPNSKKDFIAFIVDVSETEKLKQMNVAKDEFIAIASHQLRTPATTVKQYLGVILEGLAGEIGDDMRHYIEIANSANDRELSIVDELLQTARLDTEEYGLQFSTKNIVKIVRDAVADFSTPLESKQQTLTIDTQRDVILGMVDEVELKTCIINLIENASKYSDFEKPITISISQDRHVSRIVVTDHGVGINKKDYTKIFEKFTRVDNRLSDTVTGTGLGLYWVKRIIELHGGHISINSVVGKGTSVIIELPI